MNKPRILLISHNVFGFKCLEKLVKNRFNVVGVIGRVNDPLKIISDYCNSFASFCSNCNIPFYQFKNINETDAITTINSLKPDVILVLGWSQILKDELFSIPKLGIFGSHPSLLPKNRGNAAIPWQIINNEKESGLSLFKFEQNRPVDSGTIYAQKKFELTKDETAKSFYEKVVKAAEQIIEDDLEEILSGKARGLTQDEKVATYLPRRRPEDGLIDWCKDAEYIERFVRAIGDPYPGAFTFYKNKRINIIGAKIGKQKDSHEVAGTVIEIIDGQEILVKCGTGTLLITKLSDENGNVPQIKPGIKLGAI